MYLKPLSPAARILVCFGLAVPSVLMLVACILTFNNQGRIDAAFGSARHTLQMENGIRQLVLAVHAVDAAQRAYLYSGRSSQLEAFDSSKLKIASSLSALRHAITNDSTQQQLSIQLQALVANRIDLARQTVDLQTSGRHGDALKLVCSNRAAQAMDAIDRLAAQMQNHEQSVLARRDSALAARRQTHARWLYALLALHISSLPCMLFLLHWMGKAPSLARVCAWSRRVEHHGQWISFEEYLSRRFNIDTTHTISPSESDRLKRAVASEPLLFSTSVDSAGSTVVENRN